MRFFPKVLLFTSSCLLLTHTSLANPAERAATALLDSLLVQLPPSFAMTTCAVLPFSESGDPLQKQGTAVAEFMITRLSAKKSCIVVDRGSFKKVCEEISLSQSGVIDETNALSAGKMMAARYLLIGSIAPAFGTLRLTAKIIEIETGAIAASATLPLSPDALSGMTTLVYGEETSISSTLFRSLVVPGWGQFSVREPVHGTIALGGCGLAVGATIVTAVIQAQGYADYKKHNDWINSEAYRAELNDLKTPAQKDAFILNADAEDSKKYSSYQDQYRTMLICTAITGGLWTINLIDAAVVGAGARKKLDLYFSATPGSIVTGGIAYRF